MGIKERHAPRFWTERTAVSNLLSPFGVVVGSIACCRARLARPTAIDIPVICVGNLVAGGAGKTPVALSLASRLEQMGYEVHFLTRGYGGRIRGPHRVDTNVDGVHDVGDEALLLARVAPTWVSMDRAAGGRLAEQNGAQIIIMDDGFQNFSLAKNLSALVVDSEYGFGNRRVIPAGPLREPIPCGLSRADLVILLGGDNPNVTSEIPGELPLLRGKILMDPVLEKIAGDSIIAFAGIGRPEKFFTALNRSVGTVLESISFPDHHIYTAEEILNEIKEFTWNREVK